MDRLKNFWQSVWGSKKSRLAFFGVVSAAAAAALGAGYGQWSKSRSSEGTPSDEQHQTERAAPARNEAKTAAQRSHASDEGQVAHEESTDAIASTTTAEAYSSRAVAPAPAPGFVARLTDRYATAWRELNHRLGEIRRSDSENEKLRLENANLRLRVEALQFDCRAREAASRSKDIELRLSDETWAMAGRSLETITYEIPPHLLPPQLYTLAVGYFKNSEFEKAAKIMTRLTGMEDSDAFKSTRNMLMTGVLWYRLDNYALADKYFDKVLQFGDSLENNPFKAQARLWRALVAQRLDKHEKAQAWLLELLDHHPKSVEAAWVNAREGMRARIPAKQN